MKRNIIAFGHRRQVGKDSICNIIRARRSLSHGIGKEAFGDPIKDVGELLWGCVGVFPKKIYERNPGEKKVVLPEVNKSARDLWVETGEALRKIDPQVFIRLTEERISAYSNCLISDLRKKEEVDALRRLGACLVRIDRPSEPEVNDPVDSDLADYDGWDHIITNDGNLEDLGRQGLQIWDAWVNR